MPLAFTQEDFLVDIVDIDIAMHIFPAIISLLGILDWKTVTILHQIDHTKGNIVKNFIKVQNLKKLFSNFYPQVSFQNACVAHKIVTSHLKSQYLFVEI